MAVIENSLVVNIINAKGYRRILPMAMDEMAIARNPPPSYDGL